MKPQYLFCLPGPNAALREEFFIYPFNEHLLSIYWVRAKLCASSAGARRKGPDWQGRGTERKVNHETLGAAGRQAEGRGRRDKSRGMRDDGRGMRDEGAAEGREGAEWEERGPGDGVGRPGGRAPVGDHRRPRRTAGFCQAPTLAPQILWHSGSATRRGRRGGWEGGRDGQCAPEAPRPGKGGLREA